MASPGKPALYTAASRTFLPRDDVTLRPVSASVTRRSFIESAKRIELVFGTELSSTYPMALVLKTKAILPFVKLPPTGLRTFRQGTSIVLYRHSFIP